MKQLITLILLCSQLFVGAQNNMQVNQLIDSTKKYWAIDVSKAMDYANKAMSECDTTDCITYGECLKNMGVVNYFLYHIDTAEIYYRKSLRVFESCNHQKGVQAILSNLGVLYLVSGNHGEALNYYEKAYDLALQLEDTLATVRSLVNLSNIYYDLKNYPKSLSILEKGKNLVRQCDDKRIVTAYHANIYSSYKYLNDYQNWKKHIIITGKMIREMKDSSGIARLNTNLASGLLQFKTKWAKENSLPVNNLSSYYPLMDSIIRLNNRALNFFRSNKMDFEVVHIHEKLGAVYQFLQNYNVSTKHFETALKIAQTHDMKSYINSLYRNLYANMMFVGNIEKMSEYEEKISITEAEIIDEEVNSKMAAFEVKYQTLEKEQEIERQRLTIEKQKAEHERQIYFRNFLLVSTLLLIALVIFIYKNYLNKKKRNQITAEKNALLISANEEIRTQNEEIQAQRDTVIEQKAFIEKQKLRIDDSILYAKRIQNAVLPSHEQIADLLKSSFIIFKPKDVVSGDFYWVAKSNQSFYVAVADCTGHGVPGGFMSMLGITFLNEITSKYPNADTGEVLDHLRNRIIMTLRQKSDSKSQRDSIEISLMKINMQTYDCQWSGAGIPLRVIKKSETNVAMDEYIPDKMPVGIYHKIEKFKSKQMELKPGDRIIMSTDGFPDQFGGISGKRYMTSKFKQKIVDTARLTVQEQKIELEKELSGWMLNNNRVPVEQIDDITVLCFEV
ncbi:MAG: tetratricopeptide repeat protein [Salinivirgaceae bacterium]